MRARRAVRRQDRDAPCNGHREHALAMRHWAVQLNWRRTCAPPEAAAQIYQRVRMDVSDAVFSWRVRCEATKGSRREKTERSLMERIQRRASEDEMRGRDHEVGSNTGVDSAGAQLRDMRAIYERKAEKLRNGLWSRKLRYSGECAQREMKSGS